MKNIKTDRAESKRIEKGIERSILEYLAYRRIFCYKQNNSSFLIGTRFVRAFKNASGNSVCGIPDIAGYMPDGRALFIEVKRPGGKPTPDQKIFIEKAQKAGCLAFFAYSLEDVIEKVFK